MNEQGLSQQGMQPGMQGQQQADQMVMEVAKLLAQGITPEELQAQGVPMEVIQAAMEMLQAQGQPAQVEQPMQVQSDVARGLSTQRL
jgi:hypothetical protein